MRQITTIPHPQMRITVFLWNGKYLIKFEAGPYEQSYKLDETMVEDTLDLQLKITDSFINKVELRFKEMHADFITLFN
jgi:hypothetical protein